MMFRAKHSKSKRVETDIHPETKQQESLRLEQEILRLENEKKDLEVRLQKIDAPGVTTSQSKYNASEQGLLFMISTIKNDTYEELKKINAKISELSNQKKTAPIAASQENNLTISSNSTCARR